MSRNSFSIADKVKLISDYEMSKLSQKDFAAANNIPSSTLRTILKRRKEFMADTERTNRKKKKTAKFDELETILKEWFNQARSSNVPMSGPIIQGKAQEIAQRLGITDFTASTGWLDRFKNRHSIVYRKICGESKAVDRCSASDWKGQLSSLTEGYEPCQIYNAIEFCLFFKLMPDIPLVFKNEKSHGEKVSKERLTVLICTNSNGTDKRKPLVIGKYAKPRCFKSVKTLPCIYSSQSRVWMTAERFSSWLHEWDKELVRQKRSILLFVDDCEAHQKVDDLSNIKLILLPLNTSDLQPLDHGVVKVLKQGYRRRIAQLCLHKTTSEKQTINILDAIQFLDAAWRDVKPETIKNCFRKAGFLLDVAVKDEIDQEVNDVGWESLVADGSVDDDLMTNDVTVVDSMVEAHLSEPEEDEDEQSPTPTPADALNALKVVRDFFVGLPNVEDDIFHKINILEDNILKKLSN